MMNPFAVLNIEHGTTDISTIRRAYRSAALENHPDKKEGNDAMMKRINEAYQILTDPEKRQKWEGTQEADCAPGAFFLPASGIRPSENIRKLVEILNQAFSMHTLDPLSKERKQLPFKDLQTDPLYRVEAATYHSIFELLKHKNKWSPDQKPIDPSFFKQPLNPSRAVDILLKFLRGEYWGANLEQVKTYIRSQSAKMYQGNNPDVILYNAVCGIMDSTTFDQRVLNEVDALYNSAYGRPGRDNSPIIKLMQDKYFRHFINTAVTHYWQSDTPITKDILLEMKSHFENFKKLFRFGNALIGVERQIEKILTSEDASLKELYEAAYIMVDLTTFCPTYVSGANSALITGLLFQYIATIEQDASKKMSAEHLALTFYQSAIKHAAESTSVTALYIFTHVVRYLGAMQYEPCTLGPKELEKFRKKAKTNPGDASTKLPFGSTVSVMAGTMQRALYLLDIIPFYTKPKSTLDLEYVEIFQLALMRESLNDLAGRENLEDFELSKVLYHAYEESLNNWARQEENKVGALRIRTIDALLKDSENTLTDMARFVDMPYIHMKRDVEGWFEPLSELDFPERANIPIYKSFEGYEIDNNTGAIRLLCTPWKPGDAPSLKLFSEYDIFQMMQKGIIGGFFSLDHPDANKHFHPLQQMRFGPENLEGTGYLQTLFMTDYLLKMFTTGIEVSGRTPYSVRSTEKMIERLPEHLQRILNICAKAPHRGKNIAHRFWITVGKIAEYETNENGVMKTLFKDPKITIQKHRLESDERGELVDAETDTDTDSPEAKFAKEFTEHYDEIAQYFPEFRRLKELAKISGAILQLKAIRENTQRSAQSFTEILNNPARWGEIFSGAQMPEYVKQSNNPAWNTQEFEKIRQEKLKLLQDARGKFPKFSFNLHDSEVVTDYNRIYQENYNRIYTSNYNDLYQQNKTNITAQHGAAIWNREEARIATELKTSIDRQVKEMLAKNLSQQEILNQHNQQGAALRARIFQQHYDMFPDIKARLGDAAYRNCIDQFMNGNCDPLARAIAQDTMEDRKKEVDRLRSKITEIIQNKQRLEAQYKAMGLGAAENMGADHKTHLVPAAFHIRSGRRVYGGVSAFISFDREISRHAMNLNSCFPGLKESAIRDAKDFVRSTQTQLPMFTASALAYSSNLSCLERQIQRAESELLFLRIQAGSTMFSLPPFGMGPLPTFHFSSVMQDLTRPNPNPLTTDPFTLPRMEDSVNRYNSTFDAIRQSPTTIDSVLKYAKGAFIGTVQGIGDLGELIAHPYDNLLKPAGHLMLDALIITANHVPAIGLDEPDEFVMVKAAVQRKPELYHQAVKNMEARIDSIKKGVGDYFREEDPSEQARMTTRTLTNLFGASTMAKAIKYAAVTRPTLIEKPVLFSNLAEGTGEVLLPERTVPKLTASEIKGKNMTDFFIYTLLEDGELRITTRNVIKDPIFGGSFVTHADLARGQKVIFAGEVAVHDGNIRYINNGSGHYRPHGLYQPQMVEQAFERIGFPEASGKFQTAFPPTVNDPLYPTKVLNPAFPAATIGDAVTGVVIEGVRDTKD